MSTQEVLSPNTWRALYDEYDGPSCRDHGTAQAWYELLDHVRANTDIITGENDGEVITNVMTTLHGLPLVWHAREDADDVITSYDDLAFTVGLERLGRYGPVPLSDLHHDHPIFTREDNLRFRAWHDTGHLHHGLPFDERSELHLYGHQAIELRAAGRYDAADALFCESVYQLAAAVVLKGYPERQYCRKLGPVGRAVRDLLIEVAA